MSTRFLAAILLLCSPLAALAGVIEGPADIELFGIHHPLFAVDCFEEFGETCNPSVEWYVTSPGAVFSSESIASGQFPTLFEYINGLNEFGPTGTLNLREAAYLDGPLYLGYRVTNASLPDGEAYGWYATDIALNQVLTSVNVINIPSLVFLGSAATTTHNGIIVGTLTAVPEPSGSVLLFAGVIAGTWLRHRG